MNNIKCTHDVIIDDDKVIKRSSIDNPNYSGCELLSPLLTLRSGSFYEDSEPNHSLQ